MFDKKAYMKKYNKEHYEDQQTWRKNHPWKDQQKRERFRLRHPNYYRDLRNKNKDKINADVREWRRKNKEKLLAEQKCRWHATEKKCEICGSTHHLLKHHPDYSEPLVIVTLCATCHNYVHNGSWAKQ